MIGKAVWRLTFHHFSNKTTLSFGCLVRPGNVGSVLNLRPRFSSSSSLQHSAVQSTVLTRLRVVLQNVKTSKFYCTSQPDALSEEVNWEEFKDLVEANKCQIIDVREPDELQRTGLIGQSINIPVGDIGDALQMSDDAFHSKYGLKKPVGSDTNVVFYCLMGIRSKQALDAAYALGYTKARHFPGGWDEWATQNGLPVC